MGALEVRSSSSEAIAADVAQIMDSKMDSGYLETGEALDDEYDVLRTLLPEEMIGIMDQVLCHEVKSLGLRRYSRAEYVDCKPGCVAYGSSTFTNPLHLLVH